MTMPIVPHLAPIPIDQLEEYPFSPEDRLDRHYFMVWERRRWLNSDMRLRGTPECRALYFDLINIAYDQSPVGTLPCDPAILAKLLMIDSDHFRALSALEYGPLHKWRPCSCDGERRLMHPVVVQSLVEAISRKEDNRARTDVANTMKRLQRLRATVTGYSTDLGKNDAAIRWIDEWLAGEGCEYRSATWVERGLQAWTNHMLDLSRGHGRGKL